MKKTIAFILCAVMLTALTGPALADSTPRIKQFGEIDENGYGGYLAIGDSIARGMGAGGDSLYDNQYTDWSSRIVDGAYPYEIAKAVGCDIKDSLLVDNSNYWPLCFSSQTLSGVLDLLGIEDNYFDAEFVHNGKDTTWHYHWEMVPYFGCEESAENPEHIIGSAG